MNAPLSIRSEDGFRSGRLWSLWDIMKQFHTWIFLSFAEWAGRTQGYAWLAENLPEDSNRELKPLTELQKEPGIWNSLNEFCGDLELVASLATVRKIKDVLAKPESKRGDLSFLQLELQSRLVDEMQNKFFLALSASETDRFQNPRKGWESVIERFPDTVGDIYEGQKCFALSRYAAAVFHSLQVVELGVICLGHAIEVTDPHPGWTATANALQNILKKKYQERSQFEQQHWSFFEQIQATIEALKNAWRNKVSHAHGKLTLMTADFSPDVAEDILSATRAFMRRLATDGPLALGSQLS